MNRAWVLNLDAEHELERGRRYAPTDALRAIVARESARLVGDLVAPGDLVLTDAAVAAGARADGLEGAAWCPTPRAVALLERAGARAPDAPPVEVLRRVNARPFAAAVRERLEHASFDKRVAHDEDAVLARVAEPAPLGWLVRRTFGAAGRGRRRLDAGCPSADELAWIRASLRHGPLVVEPWVRVTREHTRSGTVAPDGAVTVSRPCFQRTTAEGAWLDSTHAERDALRAEDDAALEAAAHAAGEALARAGYRGPFGVDAFHHRASPGEPERLNPLSEINARFTMDRALAAAAGVVAR